ncbi:UbiX family flavin prenyltransferase [Campylobacter sp. faydin G-140]|uniref:UbiX family flavin prenyltransferase n=1 Tax=Campylobacter anatolicus TaxID=2829105 RepID=UPI001B948529|nr:UbiX family flavin prenyltransferase [Campylobacter anatolicus]
MKEIILGITGASGTLLGLELLSELSQVCQTHLIISKNAKKALWLEQGIKFDEILIGARSCNDLREIQVDNPSTDTVKNKFNINFKNVILYDNDNIGSKIASGSFRTDGMIIAPCSINTLAKVANGLSDTLITRAAAVALKERFKLVLGVREMPFSSISLHQMSDLSSMGVVIAPPVLGHYAGDENLTQVHKFIVGKWLDALGLDHKIYKRWQS